MTGGRNLTFPTLRDGAGLVLRRLRPEDADALVEACRDPEISRWTRVPSPYTHEHAREYLESSAEAAAGGEAVSLLGFDDSGALLGSFSIMDLRSQPGYGEIGYWLAKPARGRGVATRAVRLLTDWGHAALGLDRIEIVVHADNAPSHGVPVRAGYERLPGLHPLPRLEVHEHHFVRYVSRRP